MIWLSVKDRLVNELGKSFDPKIKFGDRIKVLSDLSIFNPKEDIYVWGQKRGELPEYFTVYFDNEYVCGFDEKQPVERVVLDFWKGFKKGYEEGKFKLTPKVEQPKEKKEVKKVKATTKEERMAMEIAKRLNAK